MYAATHQYTAYVLEESVTVYMHVIYQPGLIHYVYRALDLAVGTCSACCSAELVSYLNCDHTSGVTSPPIHSVLFSLINFLKYFRSPVTLHVLKYLGTVVRIKNTYCSSISQQFTIIPPPDA